jgi:type I restriction enzyme, S subunit
MKLGWVIKKMGDVLTIERGGSPRPIEKYITNSPDGLNWIKISDATASEKYIYETKEKITKDGLHKTRVVNEGDFILSNSMSFGRPYIMKTTGCIHDGWLVLKQNDKKIFDSEFLYYLLSSPFVFQQFNSKAAGSTVRNLNIALVSSVNVPIPPLPEQQQIVDILNKAFAAIAKAKSNSEQNLKNAKELFESYLQRVFEHPKDNWEVCNLETYIKLIDYRGRTPVKTESGVRLITAKNVKNGYLQIEPQEFIAENNYESWMSRGIPNIGDIIFTTEAPLANVAQIDTPDKLAFAQRIIVMQPEPAKLNQTFLKYMLLSNPIRNKILDNGTGATVLGIKSSLLKKIEIYFPKSITDQQTIVQKLDILSAETKKLESIYQKKILDLEELKKSTLQKAFNGELNTKKEYAL